MTHPPDPTLRKSVMERAEIVLQILGQPHIQNMAYMALDGFGEGLLNEPAMRWPTEHHDGVLLERVMSAVSFDHVEFGHGRGSRRKVKSRHMHPTLGQHARGAARAAPDFVDVLPSVMGFQPANELSRRAEEYSAISGGVPLI
jgi:hypothetical protein